MSLDEAQQKVLGDDELTQQILKLLSTQEDFLGDIAIAMRVDAPLFQVTKRLESLHISGRVKREGNKWKINLVNSTYVAESEQDSPLQDCNSASTFLGSQKPIHSAETSSPNDSQTHTTTATFVEYTKSIWDTISQDRKESTSLRPAHRASRSQSKVKDSEQTTSETVSLQSSKRSQNSNPNSSASKTCQDCSPANTDQLVKTVTKIDTSEFYLARFHKAGTMRNGKYCRAGNLAPPSLENDYFWLESPSALSSIGKGRPPGLSRLETQLKNLGILQKGECVNPDWLEKHYYLPIGWTSPSESRTAAQLLAEGEKPWEMPLIQELQQSPSSESSTSGNSATKTHPLEPKRQPSGTIYPYIKTKKLKSGTSATYPKIAEARDPDNPRHWFWHYCYEERRDRGWRCRKVQVPQSKVLAVRSLINSNKSIQEILQFIRGEKN